MNLKEFKKRLDFLYKSVKDPEYVEVCITIKETAIGGRAKCGIKHITLGFDWEHNQLRIEPTETLFKHQIHIKN